MHFPRDRVQEPSQNYALTPQNLLHTSLNPEALTQAVEDMTQAVENIRNDVRPKLLNFVIGTTIIAMIVINALAIAGILPGSTVGWATAGLSLGYLGAAILKAKINRAPSNTFVTPVILTLVYLSLGIAGGTGALAASKLGWACVGIPLGARGPVLGCVVICCPCLTSAACIEDDRETMIARYNTLTRFW